MLTDLDPRTQAHINLHAVLGALPELVRLVPEAAATLTAVDRPISVAFVVRGGPSATLSVETGSLSWAPGRHRATILLPFVSPGAFNAMIAGEGTPIPVTGFHRLGFLTGGFTRLTDLLGRYLQPDATALQDAEFRRVSTLLQLQVMAAAIAEVANVDRSGRYSAAHIVDGDVVLEVAGGPSYTLHAADHVLEFRSGASPRPRAVMTFSTLDVAGALLAGEVSAMACICDGSITMRGTISMVDNINRVLDRVGAYLAA